MRNKNGSARTLLIIILCLLIVALGAGGYIILSMGSPGQNVKTGAQDAQAQPSLNSEDVISKGVTVEGLDAGG